MIYKNKLRPVTRISLAFAAPVFLFATLFINAQLATAAPSMPDGPGPQPPQPPPTATLTANGAGFIVANVGDTVNFVWSSTDADTATSSYKIDSQDTCGQSGTGPFPWVATDISPGSVSGVVAPCQAGHTYTMTYKVFAVGAGFDSASVTVLVSDGSPPPVVYVSATPASFPAGGSATLSWSVLNGYTSCTPLGSWSSPPPLPSGSQTITPAMGIYTYTLNCIGKGGIGSQTQTVFVTTSATPTTGIQLSDVPSNDNALVSAGCLTTENGIPRYTPAAGGISPGAGDSNNYEAKCGQIYWSSAGPFVNTDFQIGIQLGAERGTLSCNSPANTWGPWVYTPWASQAGAGGTWSPWASDDIGFDVDCYKLVLNTRPLPAGTALTNVQAGLQFANLNPGGPYNCAQPPGQIGWPVYSAGGWSSSNPNRGTSGVGGTNGSGWTPGYDTTDCAQVFLKGGAVPLPTSNPIPASASAGTINVTNKNSQVQTTLVNASWNLSGPPGGACQNTAAPCTGTQATYANQPTGGYTILPQRAPGYVFRSVERRIFAARPGNTLDSLLSSAKDALISVANAFSFPPGNPPNQTITATGPTNVANFVILWDPIAQLGVSPTAVPVSDTSPDGTITISNPGSDGSTLNWATSTPSYAGGPTGWLSLLYSGSPSVSVLNGVSQNQNITAHANTGGIPPGACRAASPCTATVTFNGTYLAGGGSSLLAKTPSGANFVDVTATLTMSGGQLRVSIISPTPVAEGVPVQVKCTGGTGSYAWSSTGSPVFSSTNGSPITVTYPAQGTYQLTCTDGASSYTKSIVVKQKCTINASPTAVVPSQPSTLTWSCAQGTAISCTVNGSATINGTPVGTGGSASVSPTQNSTYLLSCIANNGLNTIMSSQTTVTVQGPGVIETNP